MQDCNLLKRQSYPVAPAYIRGLGCCLHHSMLMCFTIRLSFSSAELHKQFHLDTTNSIFAVQTEGDFTENIYGSCNELFFRPPTIPRKIRIFLYQLVFIFPGEVPCSSVTTAVTYRTDKLLRDKQKALQSSRC